MASCVAWTGEGTLSGGLGWAPEAVGWWRGYVRWLLGAVCEEAGTLGDRGSILPPHPLPPGRQSLDGCPCGFTVGSFSTRDCVTRRKVFLNRLKMAFPSVLQAQTQWASLPWVLCPLCPSALLLAFSGRCPLPRGSSPLHAGSSARGHRGTKALSVLANVHAFFIR